MTVICIAIAGRAVNKGMLLSSVQVDTRVIERLDGDFSTIGQ